MLEGAVIVVVMFLVLTNGGWDWLKAKWQANKDKLPDVVKPLVDDITRVNEDTIVAVHSLVDHWLALSKVPSIANDPEAAKALDILKSKILTVQPVAPPVAGGK